MCVHCGHPLNWHGDRAVCACDGGWDSDAFNRFVPQTRNGYRPVSLCGCPGWKAAWS